MRGAIVLAIIAVVVSPPALSYVVRHAAIPAPLQGTWASTREDCRNEARSMTISDKTYVDPDRSCGVLWVSETASARGSVYSAHMQCSGLAAGSRQSTDNLLLLAKDADHISVGPEFGKLKVVERCAAR